MLKGGLASADVLRSARGTRPRAARRRPIDSAALVPSLAGTGVELAAPVIQGSTAIEGKLRFKIPFRIADREKLPTSLQASARWDLLEPVAADPGAEVAADRSRRPARPSRRSSRPTSG